MKLLRGSKYQISLVYFGTVSIENEFHMHGNFHDFLMNTECIILKL